MTDIALLVGNAETAPLNESAATSVVAGHAGTGRAEGFSQLLGKQVQATRGESVSGSNFSSSIAQENGQTVAETSETEQLNGKPLPQDLSQHELLTAVQSEVTGNALALLPPASMHHPSGEAGTKGLLMNNQTSGQSASGLAEPLSNPLASNAGAAKLPHETLSREAATLQAQLVLKSERQNTLLSGKPVEVLNSNIENMGRGDKLSNSVTSDISRNLVAPTGQWVSANARLAVARAGLSEAQMNTKLVTGVRASQGLSSEGWSLQTAAGFRNAAQTTSIPEHMPIPQLMSTKADSILASITPNPSSLIVEETNSYGMLAGAQRLGGAPVTGAAPMLNVATTVGQPGWASEIGQRVTWLANSELREAQLQLHPRQLGPIEVRIVYGQEQQLNVSFSAANPVTREALDAALPRLREMFEQQGLNLANSDVSHESFAEQHRQNKADSEGESAASSMMQTGNDIDTVESAVPPSATVVIEGIIDAYA